MGQEWERVVAGGGFFGIVVVCIYYSMPTLICYAPLCEAQKHHPFTGSAAPSQEVPDLMACAQRFPSRGAEALHSPQLPCLRPRGQASQLPVGLHRKGASTLLVRAPSHGASAQAGLEKRSARRAIALRNGTRPAPAVSSRPPRENGT